MIKLADNSGQKGVVIVCLILKLAYLIFTSILFNHSEFDQIKC